MTPDEKAEWINGPETMAAEQRHQESLTSACNSPGPQTHEEARQFHQGFLSGLTVYARESGHSTLKSDNELLRRLIDEQGWKTIESFENLAVQAEKDSVPDGYYFKDDLDGGRLVKKPEYSGTAKPLTCANCGEVSTNPGQFVRDGRWVCTNKCRKALADAQSYDDLAASGGIVDAP